MKTTILATATAIALIAGTGLASAQKIESPASNTQAPNPAPAPQQNAPAEKVAPKGTVAPDRGAQMKPSKAETTSQAQPQQPQAQPKVEAQPKSSDAVKGPNAQPKSSDTAQQPNAKPSPTTGQATRPAGAAVNLTVEQKTKLRTTVVAKGPRVTKVNFSLNVGTVVPRHVRLIAVPPTLIEIHPAWRGYMYFVVNDEIIVVEPRTLKIVAVLDV